MKQIITVGVFSLWCLGLAGCSSISPMAGTESGSQTTNGIVIGLMYPDGDTGANIFGTLRPQNYLTISPEDIPEAQGSTRNVLTGSDGVLRIDSIEPGNYMLEVNDQAGFAIAVRCTVSGNRGKTDLGVRTLSPAGLIRGSVFLDPGNNASKYVQVYGLEHIAPVDRQTGEFVLSDMPTGTHILRVAALSADPAPLVLDGIIVPSGTTVTMPVGGERFSQALYFNTTPAGAGVACNVYKFPVCVRLTNSNFNFAEARIDGSDLRFAKTDNTSLPFEIERWDPTAGRAEIWVTVDTVYGNDSTHCIRMFWGNQTAMNASCGARVFDTANGFQGVWHLSDNAANATVSDALGRNNGILKSGTQEMFTSAASQMGQIGLSCGFSSDLRQWIDLGADKPFVASRPAITISIWVYTATDTAGFVPQLFNFSIGGPLAAIPESRVSLGIMGNRIQINARAHDAGMTHSYVDSTVLAPQTWYHVVGVLKIPENYIWLYINGALSLSTPNNFTGTATDPTPSKHSSIGANDVGNDRFFSGRLDEARVESQGRTRDWIKLSYENQKDRDALIMFK